jgi:hypothetical protein
MDTCFVSRHTALSTNEIWYDPKSEAFILHYLFVAIVKLQDTVRIWFFLIF